MNEKLKDKKILWVNLLERKDYLIQKSIYCLSADDIGVRIVASIGVGLAILLLRVLIFGLPYMSSEMLKSTDLTIAGVIMYLPLYIVVSVAVLIVCGYFKKKRLEKELQEVIKEINNSKLCW